MRSKSNLKWHYSSCCKPYAALLCAFSRLQLTTVGQHLYFQMIVSLSSSWRFSLQYLGILSLTRHLQIC